MARARWRIWLTITLWLLLLGGSILLLVSEMIFTLPLPLPLSLFGVALLFFVEFLLLLRYVRALAQWRGIFLLWFCYTLARMASAWGPLADRPILITAALMAVLYAMVGGWFAITALAIRRDVSVAYLLLFFALAPLIFRAEVAAAGGVLAFLQPQTADSGVRSFAISETLVMALAPMPPLALLSFIPHFLRLWWQEWQRPLLLPRNQSQITQIPQI